MSGTRTPTGAGKRRRTAALIAVFALVVALAWGAVMVVGLSSDVQDFPRTDIPGDLTVDIEETGTQVVYYERRAWFATVPVDVDLEVTVTGPDGQPVPVTELDGTANYRLLRLVGQSEASFVADAAGTYTVTVEDDPPHEDASVAVGESVTRTVLRDLAGPAIVLVAGLVVAAIVAATARR